MVAKSAYNQGDIILVSFEPSRSHEPKKTRPAVVISTGMFNRLVNLTVVVPVTSTVNDFPLHVELSSENVVHGSVCVEQLKALDLEQRYTRKLGRIEAPEMTRILELVRSIFGV